MAEKVNHSERAHALLSASSAERWLSCAPSAVLEDNYPDQSSEYALEGTLAHELAELKLRSKLNLVLNRRETEEETKRRREKTKEIQESNFYSKEMEEHTSNYVNYIIEEFMAVRLYDKAAVLFIEARLNFSHIVPEGFGTGDAVILGNGVMKVIDLKYGAGKKVDAVENSQLKLYGVGAVAMFDDLYEFEAVELVIYQPRMDNISVYATTVEALDTWATQTVAPRAEQAFKGEGELVTGDHCGFCKHRVKCRAMFDETVDLFDKAVSDDLRTVSDNEILEVFKKSDRVSKYLSAVASYILSEALSGKSWEGYKLVEGRSVRTISDEDKAEEILKANGFGIEDLYNMKMKGLGDLEKLVGKKEFNELLKGVIVKPAGKPTLAPESDKRPAINITETAQKLFDALPEEEDEI